MKTAALLCSLAVALGGCVRKSELDQTRLELSEARLRIEQLEAERVPRVQYDAARASLRLADERISTLEKKLNDAYDLLAEHPASTHSDAAPQSGVTPDAPAALQLTSGGYAVSNDTHVYSPDSRLELGEHLTISSPTGLMVSDTDHRIVGGDLAIRTKGMTMETSDGLLAAQADGSVKFTGSTLTMKFGKDADPAEEPTKDQPPEMSPPATSPTPTTR